MKRFIFLVLAIVLIAGCTQTQPIACTADAKVCPDGSAVGRVPPNCDFAPCPETNLTEETENVVPPSSPPSTPPINDTTLPVEPPKTFDVSIRSFVYTPTIKTINVGDSIRWTNYDAVEQSATADDNSFDTGLLSKGESKTITFNTNGTYSYHCTSNSWMKGKITVVQKQ